MRKKKTDSFNIFSPINIKEKLDYTLGESALSFKNNKIFGGKQAAQTNIAVIDEMR